jgi:phage-related minor tail protein
MPDMVKEIQTPPALQEILDRNKDIEASFQAIGNSVARAFQGMVTGAQSFGDAMKGIIQTVIDELFRLFVVQQIVGFVSKTLGSVTGVPTTGLPARALGGSVSANTPYLVGERGPELFMPGKSGTVIPTQNTPQGGTGGGMTINVDARGSTDPEAVKRQVQQGILEAAPSIVAAAEQRTISTLRRPRLAGVM